MFFLLSLVNSNATYVLYEFFFLSTLYTYVKYLETTIKREKRIIRIHKHIIRLYKKMFFLVVKKDTGAPFFRIVLRR